MVKYIITAISICFLTISITKTIEYFYTCINAYCDYQDRYITGLFEEAGL